MPRTFRRRDVLSVKVHRNGPVTVYMTGETKAHLEALRIKSGERISALIREMAKERYERDVGKA